jgi:hypothetical protein
MVISFYIEIRNIAPALMQMWRAFLKGRLAKWEMARLLPVFHRAYQIKATR